MITEDHPRFHGGWDILHFCAIRSYVSTMKKHDYNILDGLRELFQGRVWLPGGT